MTNEPERHGNPTSEPGIWLEAWNVGKLNWMIFVLVTFLFASVTVINDLSGTVDIGFGIPHLVIWSTMAIAAYRTVLLGDAGPASVFRPVIFLPFALAAFVLSLIVRVPSNVLLDYLILHMSVETSRSMLVPVLNLGSTFIYIIVYGFLGTWLPAIVAKKNWSPFAALSRGVATLDYSLPRLAVGPGLLQIGVVSLWNLNLGSDYLPNRDIYQLDSSINYFGLAFIVVTTLINVYAIVLGAVILARAYVRTESGNSSL